VDPEGPRTATDEWICRAAQTVKGARSQWQDLPEAALRELVEACRPGFAALGDLYAG
jgi:hypothetical protein